MLVLPWVDSKIACADREVHQTLADLDMPDYFRLPAVGHPVQPMYTGRVCAPELTASPSSSVPELTTFDSEELAEFGRSLSDPCAITGRTQGQLYCTHR